MRHSYPIIVMLFLSMVTAHVAQATVNKQPPTNIEFSAEPTPVQSGVWCGYPPSKSYNNSDDSASSMSARHQALLHAYETACSALSNVTYGSSRRMFSQWALICDSTRSSYNPSVCKGGAACLQLTTQVDDPTKQMPCHVAGTTQSGSTITGTCTVTGIYTDGGAACPTPVCTPPAVYDSINYACVTPATPPPPPSSCNTGEALDNGKCVSTCADSIAGNTRADKLKALQTSVARLELGMKGKSQNLIPTNIKSAYATQKPCCDTLNRQLYGKTTCLQ